MAQALYRRWRPQLWDEVVGQDHVVQTLRNAVKGGRVAHAYLFAGPRGTGKTTTARILAKAVNCEAESTAERPCNACPPCLAVVDGRYIDLIEIDAASNTSVDDVRDLREKINFSPNEGRYKVYIVDEVHMLSTAAFNALLKTLEEPPPHAIFVLATTEVHKIPPTVLSRCQRHEFRRLSTATIADYLSEKAEETGLQVEPDALRLVARQATGSLRDAISLLDQLASTGEAVTLERAQMILGAVPMDSVRQIIDSILARDAGQGLTLINQTLDAGADPQQFARQIVAYLRAALMVRTGNDAPLEFSAEANESLASQAAAFSTGGLLAALEAFNAAAHTRLDSWHPSLPLELALLDAVGFDEAAVEGGGGAPGAEPEEGSRTGPNPGRDPTPPKEAAGDETDAGPAQDPASAPSAPSASASPPLASGPVTFPQVMERWKEILGAAFKLNARTQALLNSSKPLGIRDGALILGFASDLLREKMEKGDNLRMACDAVEEVLGLPITVRCVLISAWDEGSTHESPPPPMEEEGMVATALRDLGARVVDHKEVPPQAGS